MNIWLQHIEMLISSGKQLTSKNDQHFPGETTWNIGDIYVPTWVVDGLRKSKYIDDLDAVTIKGKEYLQKYYADKSIQLGAFIPLSREEAFFQTQREFYLHTFPEKYVSIKGEKTICVGDTEKDVIERIEYILGPGVNTFIRKVTPDSFDLYVEVPRAYVDL